MIRSASLIGLALPLGGERLDLSRVVEHLPACSEPDRRQAVFFFKPVECAGGDAAQKLTSLFARKKLNADSKST
ncbi:hypothetical protein LCM4577_15165 [Mesorhizobium sp. LCM 4577]|nr:hypothetical protein LCM4577_15165 [Mesorhizobium sp. LCM 4577]